MQIFYKAEKPEKLYRTAWTKICIPELRDVGLEPSAKRGANGTKALASFYWSSQSLHPKEPPNQISHKSTKVDPIRLSETWRKSYQISKSFALQNTQAWKTSKTIDESMT